MKKSDPFSGIPSEPRSIAGQWLAFSHMANHYRKLLNVKPRVNSSVPKLSGITSRTGSSSLASYLKGVHLAQKPPTPSRPLSPAPTLKKSKLKPNSSGKVGKVSNSTSLNISPKLRPASKVKSSTTNYQLVYGPVSLKNSTAEVCGTTDCDGSESDEMREPMGVAEKIKAFLDNLHHFGPKSKPSKKSTKLEENPKKCLSSYPTTRENRHSKCFLPSSSPHSTPSKGNKSRQGIGGGGPRPSTPSRLATATSKSSTVAKPVIKSKNGGAGTKSRARYNSGGSVGTILGSEVLTAEDLPELCLKSCIKRGNTTNPRTSSAGYCSQSASGKATSQSSGGIVQQDSSRDSAYGFSSGESRIPSTRESTPEKLAKGRKQSVVKKKYKSALSTVASSMDQQPKSSTKSAKSPRSPKSPKKIRPVPKVLSTDDQYLNFITQVTEDIVERATYTNKGLKALFKEHLDNHVGLDKTRLKEMLEKLRVDLGVPQDDGLNKLEFGYGSVNGGARPTTPTVLRDCVGKVISFDDFMPPPPPYPSYEQFHRARHQSKPMPNHGHVEKEFVVSEGDGGGMSDSSVSETDLKLVLKEVGIDSETSLEIVGVLRMNRFKEARSLGSSSGDDLGPRQTPPPHNNSTQTSSASS